RSVAPGFVSFSVVELVALRRVAPRPAAQGHAARLSVACKRFRRCTRRGCRSATTATLCKKVGCARLRGVESCHSHHSTPPFTALSTCEEMWSFRRLYQKARDGERKPPLACGAANFFSFHKLWRDSVMKLKEPMPVTVLTGFLGAGKTTLLNHLLSQNHGYRCAIIINEFGEVSIDHQLLVRADEEILELNNGCLCCRVRKDLVQSLGDLFKRQKRFDYVLVETTGLAHPGPVAQTFFLPELAQVLRLDAIVTLADARHLEHELTQAPEASAQVAFADVILLNKTDLVAQADLARVEARIRSMNSLAQIHRTQRARIDVRRILDIKARDLNAPLEMPKAAEQHKNEHGEDPADGNEEHAHEDHDAPGHSHFHDEQVRSFSIVEERPL